MDNSRRILCCVDFSNFSYDAMFAAARKWIDQSDNAVIIRPANDSDQDNLPDITTFSDFRRILHNTVQDKLGTISWILKNHHQDEIDEADGIDVILAMDDYTKTGFRKQRYPAYKSQRRLQKRQYDIGKLKEYYYNVVLPELDVENTLGYRFMKVDDAEADDIIATIMRFHTDYMLRVIISSDHDYLQIDGVSQYNMWGKEIKREIDGRTLTKEEYLLWKEICGDPSDNISGVFNGIGEKRSLKLVDDRERLRNMLKESQDAWNQYSLNRFLIDFSNIPSDLSSAIIDKVDGKLNDRKDSRSLLMEDLDDLGL